ncbi:hypothetical protein SEA_MOAB_97 [Streptomyces phage Moab]|nr:hypothetical protein SEA_MOAB_97 [Streptomyces phage Moab]
MTNPPTENQSSRRKREWGVDMDALVEQVTNALRNEDEVVTIPGETGPMGPEGPAGNDGKSAMEIWLENGGSGNVHDFMNAIRGEKGDEGPQGNQGESIEGPRGNQGIQGEPGNDGQSAYDLAVSEGYTGSLHDWVSSLKGVDGDIGPQGPKGDTGDRGLKGEKGDTGNVGAQGIQGVPGAKGDKGDTGSIGPQGLKGDTGAQGPKGDTGATGPAGSTGAQGIQGVKGDTGNTGAAGTSAQVWFNGTVKSAPKIFVATATTDATGKFTVDLSAAGFTEVFSANVVPVASNNTAAGQAFSNVLSLSTTSLTGTVSAGISIVLGGLGIALVGAGRTVHATVYGR